MKPSTAYRLVLIAWIVVFTACGLNTRNQDSSVETNALEPLEFYNKTNQKVHGVILDLRSAAKFQEGSIWGAVNLHYLDANFEQAIEQIINSSSDRPILIYCNNGVNSGRVASMLAKEGVEEVYIMSGGYQEWKDSGL